VQLKNKVIKIVGVAGGSGSGKSTFSSLLKNKINDSFGINTCNLLAQDNYYIDQSKSFDHDGGSVNFDHPDSIDFNLLYEHLLALKNDNSILVPKYEFATHSRSEQTIKFGPYQIIIIEGTLIFSNPKIIQILDEAIFIDTCQDIRYERRKQRDITERGRTLEGVKNQFFNQVAPMHNQFVEPSKSSSNITIKDPLKIEIYDTYIEKIINSL
jgi:uridine kinase